MPEENKQPTLANLNPQYYSAGLSSELLYYKLKQKVNQISELSGENLDYLQNLLEDFCNIINTGLESNENKDTKKEILYFDVLYNKIVEIYNSTILLDYDEGGWKDIFNKLKEAEEELRSYRPSNNKDYVSVYLSPNEKYNFEQKSPNFILKNSYYNTSKSYLKLCSNNIFPASYTLTIPRLATDDRSGSYIVRLRHDMPPVEYGGLKYSVNEYGGIEIRLLTKDVSKIKCLNIGLDFADYPNTFEYSDKSQAYAFPIVSQDASRTKFRLYCVDNANELKISPYKNVVGVPIINGAGSTLLPTVKLQVNYLAYVKEVIDEEGNKKTETGCIDVNGNNTGARVSSPTVWNGTGVLEIPGNRVLRMANIELGFSQRKKADGTIEEGESPRMLPFWQSMIIQNEEKHIEPPYEPLIVYPVLENVSSETKIFSNAAADPYYDKDWDNYTEVSGDFIWGTTNLDTENEKERPEDLPYQYFELDSSARILVEATCEKGYYNTLSLVAEPNDTRVQSFYLGGLK